MAGLSPALRQAFLRDPQGRAAEIFPEECGLFLSDGYDAHIIRDAPEHKLPPAVRKSVTLNFSRIAAQRLLMAELALESGRPLPPSWEDG